MFTWSDVRDLFVAGTSRSENHRFRAMPPVELELSAHPFGELLKKEEETKKICYSSFKKIWVNYLLRKTQISWLENRICKTNV